MADLFRNGSFATTYLSPRDYHRVHMPVSYTHLVGLYHCTWRRARLRIQAGRDIQRHHRRRVVVRLVDEHRNGIARRTAQTLSLIHI